MTGPTVRMCFLIRFRHLYLHRWCCCHLIPRTGCADEHDVEKDDVSEDVIRDADDEDDADGEDEMKGVILILIPDWKKVMMRVNHPHGHRPHDPRPRISVPSHCHPVL